MVCKLGLSSKRFDQYNRCVYAQEESRDFPVFVKADKRCRRYRMTNTALVRGDRSGLATITPGSVVTGTQLLAGVSLKLAQGPGCRAAHRAQGACPAGFHP
jgi:hypothetical protein